MPFEIEFWWDGSDFYASGNTVRAVDHRRDAFFEHLRSSVFGGLFVLHSEGRQFAVETRILAAEAGDKWPTMRTQIHAMGASTDSGLEDLAPQLWSPEELDAVEPMAVEALLVHGFDWDGELLHDGTLIVFDRAGRGHTLADYGYAGHEGWMLPTVRKPVIPHLLTSVEDSMQLVPALDACVIAAMYNIRVFPRPQITVGPQRVRDDVEEGDVLRGVELWEKLSHPRFPEGLVTVEARMDHLAGIAPGLMPSTYFRVLQHLERAQRAGAKRRSIELRRLIARARRMDILDGVFALVHAQKDRNNVIDVPSVREVLSDLYPTEELDRAVRRANELLTAGSRYVPGDFLGFLESLRKAFPDFSDYSRSKAMDWGARINR